MSKVQLLRVVENEQETCDGAFRDLSASVGLEDIPTPVIATYFLY